MNFDTLTPEQLRAQNHAIATVSRKFCAKIGAIWHQIENRKLWKEWGYESYEECIIEEGPRAYSSIFECVLNYTYFVIEGGIEWEEFEKMMVENGLRKMSLIRRQAKITMPEPVEVYTPDKPAPEYLPVPQAIKKTIIEEAEILMKKVSVKKAREVLDLTAKDKGIEVQQTIVRKFFFAPDQDEVVQEALIHIKSRAKGMSVMSDSIALSLLCGEYLSQNGMRKIAA